MTPEQQALARRIASTDDPQARAMMQQALDAWVNAPEGVLDEERAERVNREHPPPFESITIKVETAEVVEVTPNRDFVPWTPTEPSWSTVESLQAATVTTIRMPRARGPRSSRRLAPLASSRPVARLPEVLTATSRPRLNL